MKRIKINNLDTDYFISEDGEIYSEKSKKFLSGDINTGYKRVLLCLRNGERIKKPVHTLVAEAYIPNINNLPIVHHKDGDKLNNNVNNLEWIDYSTNVKKENRKSHPKKENTFSSEELEKEVWKVFRDTNYSVSNLGRLINNKTNKIIKGHINYFLGYIRDTLSLEDKNIIITRHRMVYEAFHPNEIINIINHKDGIRFNNRLDNLENISPSENLKKAYTETKTRRTRKCLCYNLKENLVFFSIADASRHFNCNESQIRLAMNRKGKYKDYNILELTEEEYSQILIEGPETIKKIIREKDSNE